MLGAKPGLEIKEAKSPIKENYKRTNLIEENVAPITAECFETTEPQNRYLESSVIRKMHISVYYTASQNRRLCIVGSDVYAAMSKKRRFNVSPEARTGEILCTPTEE